jgi:hypothetical protein
MAKNSIVDAALANIDAQIADLQRARQIIVDAQPGAETQADKPKRGRKPRQRGLPAGEAIGTAM